MEDNKEYKRETTKQTEPGGDTKEVVTEKKTSSHPPVGKEKTVMHNVRHVFYFLLGVIEVLLIARFLAKFLAANPLSGFVSLIYFFTDPLVALFVGIFKTSSPGGPEVRSIFEPASLVAMAFYGVVVWGIVTFIRLKETHPSPKITDESREDNV